MHLIKGPYVLVWYFSLHTSIYILFSLWTLSFSMPYSLMTSPRYYDVTHFLTDLNENCTAYVKLKIKDILFVRIFLIFGIFIEKITINYENHVNYCPVTLHLPPIPFGPPIRVGFVRYASLTYRRILFQYWKQKKNNSFYLNWWKPGSIPIIPPPHPFAPR